jgi:two-component system phosphate regulon sensor histidine kinase PhoR
MNWTRAASQVGLYLAAAAALGWLYGRPLWAVAGALLGLVAFWLYQMRQVSRWLANPVQPPPEIYGVWGDILSQVYQLQKKGREARAHLQSTVDYLQNSFASMRDGVAIVDGRGVLKWYNEPARQLLGLRPHDEGQNLMNLVRAPELLRYFKRGEFGEPLEYHTGSDSGTWLRVEITRFGDGERLVFIRDVTAAVRMEKVRKDFVANVSHELRTPLTVISGYLATFLSEPGRLDSRYIKPLQQMLQQAERMENLLKDLLWLAQIESEQGIERHSQVDIRALLAELQDELRSTRPGRVIELELATEHTVAGDYRELYSAVSNLVLNAIKYSQDSSVVKISWRRQDGSYVLAVSDKGIGIEATHIPRLTERFYRVEDARSAATGGTGLGLAIVKHVAATHGARLQIESKVGKGSTFSLVFPDQGQAVAQRRAGSAVT